MTTAIHRKYKALPTLSMFHHDDSFYRGVRGPVRSGKSTGMCMEIFRRGMEQRPGADGIRRTRWAIVRNTYKELLDTTLKTWNMWFGYLNRDVSSEYPGCTWHKQDMTHFIKVVDPKGGPVEMEVMFRALDRPGDEAKLLSLEVTGAWVNEAREIPKGVIDTLGDRVGQFPAKMDGGCTYHGVMMDTNAPDDEHWWFKASEEDAPNGELPDWRFFTQPGALMEVEGKFVANPQAENIQNLDEGMNYYFKRLQNKDYQYIKVYYCGEYGYSMEGMLVHPEFKPEKHRAKEVLAPIPGLPIVIGLDFGLTPAAVFGQRKPTGHWQIIDEICTQDLGTKRFGELFLLPKMQGEYGGFEFEVWGDPGAHRAETDETTSFQILQAMGINANPAPTNNPLLRREALSSPINRGYEGIPGCIISPKCKNLISGLAKKYIYKEIKSSGGLKHHDKPDKNWHSHVCEAAEYMMLGAGEGKSLTSKPVSSKPRLTRMKQLSEHAWMGS